MRQVVLDTETTGLEPELGHRIIEIGCIEVVNRRRTGRVFHRYLCPDRAIDPGALQVHGLTAEFLAGQPRFADVAADWLEFVRGAELVIHNAAFDVGFLNKELELTGRPPFKTYVESVTDTLAMAKEMFPGKRNSLDAQCDRLEVDNSGRTLHGALLDAELLADVYINLTRGQDALLMADEPQESADGVVVPSVDLSRFALQVVAANEQELSTHEDVMTQIDKSSGGKTIWRKLQAAS